MMHDGPWYENSGPSGKQVRVQLCAEKSSLSPLAFLCWQKAVYEIIDADQSDFGSWRGWATFGLLPSRKQSIQDTYERYLENIPFIKRVLSHYISHQLYKPDTARFAKLAADNSKFYKAADASTPSTTSSGKLSSGVAAP